jgi:hypothetical protein
MNSKKYRTQFTIKFSIALLILITLSFIVLLSVYRLEFNLSNISNSIFIVSAPVFFVSLIIQTGATRATLAISYTAKTWFAPKSTKDQFDNFQEYYDEKSQGHQKDVKFLVFAALVMIIAAFVLAQIVIDARPNM